MKLGKVSSFIIISIFSLCTLLLAEDKIISAPIINLENLEPSYENLESDKEAIINSGSEIKKRNIINKKGDNIKFVNLVGLDKITAKTIPIKIKLGEKKNDSVAYLQVRDVSENQNEKVFIFNGWTFSSNPSLTPIDHAIYDIWLVGCEST